MSIHPALSRSYYVAPCTGAVMHTQPELLDFRGTRHPEREAFVIRDMGKPRKAITFGELKAKTEQLGAGMVRRGLRKGDSVGLFCSTSLEYAICQYAVARTGAILIRFHVSVKTGEDLRSQIAIGKCKWLFIQPGNHDENYKTLLNAIPGLDKHAPTQTTVEDDVPNLEAVFMISSSSYPGTESWTTFFEGNTEHDLEMLRCRQSMIELDDIQCCLATSGSTGTPKLVAHSHAGAAREPLSLFGVGETDKMLIDRPMPYVGGSSGCVISKGVTMVYVKTSTTVSGEDEGKDYFFRMFEEEKCTAIGLYPYLLRRFLQKVEAGELNTERIKLGFTGGERIPKPILERIMRQVPSFVNMYGGTETGTSVMGGLANDPIEKRVNFTGRGYEGEYKIIDEEGHIVPINQAGELCYRARTMFRFYWGDEEKTKQAIDDLGWFKTSDMAIMNEDGYVTILGRKQEVISKAVIKIYPEAIEKEIVKHPFVKQAVAVGVPHEILYEEIALCVVPKKGVTLTRPDLRLFCEGKFLGSEDGFGLMPDYFLIFDKFPTGASDKLDRKKLRGEVIARLNNK